MKSHLTEERHSEERSQQPFARVHHFSHFTVRAVQRVIQMSQFLSHNINYTEYWFMMAPHIIDSQICVMLFLPQSLCVSHRWE